jgi:hypothetical protein
VKLFQRSESRSLPVPPKVAAERERARPKRILVIGSDGHGRDVTSYRWEKLPTGINVADYDVVVLNFAAFAADSVLAEGFPVDRLPSLESMTRLLFAPQSEIVAIGSPATLIGPPSKPGQSQQPFYDGRERADYWLPFYLGVEDNKGRSYEVLDGEWRYFFEGLSEYHWIASSDLPVRYPEPAHYLAPVTTQANEIFFRVDALAQTRFEKAIEMKVVVRAVRAYRHNPAGSPVASSDGIAEAHDVVAESSPVFWLPTPDQVDPTEAIDLILGERYGVAENLREPGWVRGFALPAEAPIAAEIAGLEGRRSTLEVEIDAARARAVEAAAPKLLLYEKGKQVLEPIVRSSLRQLGAEVDDPQEEGIEDGLLGRPPSAAAVLEIKGRKGQIKQDDVRQVVQWASDARGRDGVAYKPIIVGNPHCEEEPAQRGDPLTAKALEYAINSDAALLTTVQIFEALSRRQRGQFDDEAFWAAVFAAKGVVELPSR